MIHFSGMRYASANDTYGPPKELIATLKEQEIREMFEDPDRKDEVETDGGGDRGPRSRASFNRISSAPRVKPHFAT